MGATASRVDEAAILARVYSLQKDTTGWPSVIHEFLQAVPPGTTLRIKDRRVLEMVLTLCEQEMLRMGLCERSPAESEDMAMLIDATGRLLSARGLYAHLPRFSLRGFVDAARPSPNNALVPPLLQYFMTVVHFSGVTCADDERLERAAKLHFEACGGVDLILELLCHFGAVDGPPVDNPPGTARLILHYTLQILQSLMLVHVATTEYSTLTKRVRWSQTGGL